jgi:RNA polymerase sigma factor (sigma-70 family)
MISGRKEHVPVIGSSPAATTMMTHDEQRAFYEEYFPRVVKYLVAAFRFTDDEARDLAQDVFVGVFVHVEPITNPWPFVKTSAHHRAVNLIRSRSIRRPIERDSVEAMPELDNRALTDFFSGAVPPSPEDEASHNEQVALLSKAIVVLPAILRNCLLLRLNGLSYKEIAVALQITEDAVRTRLRDAKRLLVIRGPGGE